MNGETNWLTPDLLKRAKAIARKEGGGRRILMRALGLTDHKARIMADVVAGRAEVPTQKPNMVPAETLVKVPGRTSGKYKFAIVADTHLGSNAQQLTMLNQAYDTFERLGIHQVWHLGDLTDGIDVFRGQHQEQFLHTADDQVEYAIENYPKRDGIVTSLIAGNHDLSTTLKGGFDPMRALAAERDDIKYLGPLSARVRMGEVTMYLLHPKGGMGYAKSYRLQRLIESQEGGRKDLIHALGHWHSQVWVIERHCYGLLPGCFQAQTSYERGKMLQPQLGATIIDLEVRGDEISHVVTPTFLHWFVPRDMDR